MKQTRSVSQITTVDNNTGRPIKKQKLSDNTVTTTPLSTDPQDRPVKREEVLRYYASLCPDVCRSSFSSPSKKRTVQLRCVPKKRNFTDPEVLQRLLRLRF